MPGSEIRQSRGRVVWLGIKHLESGEMAGSESSGCYDIPELKVLSGADQIKPFPMRYE